LLNYPNIATNLFSRVYQFWY